MAYYQDSDASLVRAVDNGVREIDQREGLATICRCRADAGELLEKLRNSFEFVQQASGDAGAGFLLVETNRFAQVVGGEPVYRSAICLTDVYNRSEDTQAGVAV